MASAVELPWELWPDGWAPAPPLLVPKRKTLAMRPQGKGEVSPGTYKDDSWRDKTPADLEEEGWWESQHHLDVLEVVPMPWRGGGGGSVDQAGQCGLGRPWKVGHSP